MVNRVLIVTLPVVALFCGGVIIYERFKHGKTGLFDVCLSRNTLAAAAAAFLHVALVFLSAHYDW